MTAKARYDALSSDRSQFLNVAEQATKLTLPYLIRGEENYSGGARNLVTPWQSVGAKGVVTLASKLMLALLPPSTSFFKLQLDENALQGGIPPEMRSELDLSFAKIERTILESIAASSDRVIVHQALKHLIVAGNVLIFMGESGLKMFPLNRYVIERDGNNNVIEIVTKERIHKSLLENIVPEDFMLDEKKDVTEDDEHLDGQEIDIYTHCLRVGNNYEWHQEVYDKKIPGSNGKAPATATPWLVLTFNTVDGEAYGRGRVEEFMGDLKSLEALMQALVEGSASAAKVVFTVSPSSTTKPQTLAQAGNGAIIQGRPDDIGVVNVGKTADFRTAFEMAMQLEKRLNEAFLILNVRQSERTTAEEVRMTQMELDQQLGGLYSLLTIDLLVPYLSRKLSVFQKSGEIPTIPGDMVKPTIVAGVNALGRGQDRESLVQFITTIAQAMGPEAMMQHINPEEAIKRLAAAQGIDVLNLVRSMQEIQAERDQARQQALEMQQQQMQIQAMKTPLADPTKNPQLAQRLEAGGQQEIGPADLPTSN
tara:strand:+ start:1946 stop:3556 length:1611 start_codon:yes stop_codon:yes gene_type:complete